MSQTLTQRSDWMKSMNNYNVCGYINLDFFQLRAVRLEKVNKGNEQFIPKKSKQL